ncbi:MAG: tRNA 4-thiouridine(8) synthase ThiI [Defluviitaleaceae bacterium]|nr:tRNA 4-thiouridine(8) synthase ThiI [Defluviitaleaceae bacterium]
MTKKVLLIKYGEIALRKGNRAHFEHHLLDAIRHNIKEEIAAGELKVSREQGRFLVENPNGDVNADAILPRIKDIFGLTKFCLAVKTAATDINELKPIALAFFRDQVGGHKTFKVVTKRSDKNYPLLSGQVSMEIGETIFSSDLGLAVDLHHPDITLWVEIRNHIYFYVDGVDGQGGLPYGTNGKGVLLLSGGFDSPVAGYLMARRGVEMVGIYFHSPPFVSERAADKVKDLARALSKFTGKIKLCVIPFTEVQLFLKDATHPDKLTILLKRAMLHIASALAEKEGAQCLVTGDSIGQVASQTMQSLAAVHSAAAQTILRPLAAMDKQQIIDIAKNIGTHPISIRPYDDCCTLFVAKHPENKPSAKAIEKIEGQIFDKLAPMMAKALEDAEYFEL